MSDWLALVFSYSIADFIPMESEIYVRLFERANSMLWPLPLVGVLLPIFLLFIILSKIQYKRWYYCLWILASLAWLFVGFIFFLQLFAELNWIGHYLGIGFIIQGILLLLSCFFSLLKPIQPIQKSSQTTGATTLLLGLSCYTLIPWLSGRSWQSVEVFAIAPDPTCLATIAIMSATGITRWWLLIIPLLWCFISLCLSYAMDLYGGFILVLAVMILFVDKFLYRRMYKPTDTL